MFTPLAISFQFFKEIAEDRGYFLYWLDEAVNMIFALDILIHFFCSYVDMKMGEEVFKPSYIIKRYLGGHFFIDFISTVPIKRMINALISDPHKLVLATADLCTMLKVVRIRKLIKKIR